MPDCMWCGAAIEGMPFFYPVSKTALFPGTHCSPPCAKAAMMDRRIPKYYSLFFERYGRVPAAPARVLLERYGGPVKCEVFAEWSKKNTVSHASNVCYEGTRLFESHPNVTEVTVDPVAAPVDADDQPEPDEAAEAEEDGDD